MNLAQYDIFLLNENRAPIAQLSSFKRAEIVRRFNAAGSWVITLDGEALDVDNLRWLGGMRVLRDGLSYFEGVFLEMSDENLESPDGEITLAGTDYFYYLEKRLAVSVPSGPPYSGSEYDTRSGAAGDVIKGYVRYHLGSLAKTERQVGGLTVANDLGDGGTVTGRGRFGTVLEMAQAKALEGGDLGFRFAGTEFQTFTPADKSGSVRFSATHGTLTRYKRTVKRPNANYIIGGGSGEGTARVFAESYDQDSVNQYGRVEWFYDYRNVGGLAELTSAINGKLAELAQTVTVEIEAANTTGVQFVRDYDLGDKVMVILPGLTYTNVVRELKLTLDGSGEHVAPVVGTPGATALNALNRMFAGNKQINNRVSLMERI